MPDIKHTAPSNPAAMVPRQRLVPGTMLGDRYEIVRALAQGGFGAVYEARHVHAKRRVAVKVLHAWLADDPNTRERFRRELQAPAQIAHPGIVEVLDADVDPSGIPYLVMDYLEGETLRERLEQGRLSLTELRDVFDPFLDALDAAHSAGFIHRDLKPENCMLIRDSDGVERPRIVDFGLARKTGANSVTVTGTSLGTPRYMSPEQFMDAKEVGPESDVWSVGAMMYEALVGEPPFGAKRSHALMLQILTEAHPPVKSHLPHLPPRLARLIEQCLDKEPGNRPPDAHALRSRFLGAFAAISGGLALRTIPEMPQSNIAVSVSKPSAESLQTRNQRPPRAARVTQAARPRPTPPTAQQPSWMPAPPTFERPSASPKRAIFLVIGLVVAFAVMTVMAVAFYVLFVRLDDSGALHTERPRQTQPAHASEPGAVTPMRPVPSEVSARPEAPTPWEDQADTEGPAYPDDEDEDEEEDEEEEEEDEGSGHPLAPLTAPLDQLLFE